MGKLLPLLLGVYSVLFLACAEKSWTLPELTLTFRELGGDFTQLNEVLKDVKINVSTDALTPEPVDTGFFGITAEIFLFGGYCSDLKILIPENGDIILNSAFEANEIIDTIDYEKYFIEILFRHLDFKCFIDMQVVTSSLASVQDPGLLLFTPSKVDQPIGAFLSTSIDVYSEDFSTKNPELVNNTGCTCDISKLDYSESEKLGYVNFFGDIDITGIILGIIEDDPTLVQYPVQDELCAIVSNLTDLIGDLIIENPLTNISLSNSSILDAENSLNVTSEVNLLDLSDNFITNALFPENETESPLFNLSDTLSLLLNGSSLSGLLGDFLGVDTGDGQGINNLNLVELIGPLLNENYDPAAPLINISNTSLLGAILNLELFVDELNITTTKTDIDLSTLAFPGKQTITIPTVDVGDLDLTSKLRILLSVEGLSLGPVSIDSLFFDESFEIVLDWDALSVSASALLAVDLNTIPNLQFGGLTTETLTCLVSTLVTPPMITGLDIGSDTINILLSSFEDAIFVLLQDVVNAIFPVAEGAIKKAIVLALDSFVVNQDLLEPQICPEADVADKNVKYDFSEGIFKTISDFIDTDLVETVLDLLLSDGETEASISLLNETIAFDFDLPQIGSETQNIELVVNELAIGSELSPPYVGNVTLLYANPFSEYSPQELNNQLSIAAPINPVYLLLDFELNLKPGKSDSRRRLDVLTQQNAVSIKISLDNINFILDLYAKYSKYAVDSITLGDALNIDCWVGRLEDGGGILDLLLALKGLNINATCDCQLELLNSLIESISSDEGEDSLLEAVNFLFEILLSFVEESFKGEAGERTIENAYRRCNGLAELSDGSYDLSIDESQNLAAILGGALGCTLLAAFMFPYCCRARRKPMMEKKDVIEEESQPSLLFQPALPVYVRFGMPALFLGNIVLFIFGDFDIAVSAALDGEILGIPVGLDDVADFSVITSTQKLIEEESWGLAIMIIIMAIIWPYLKLFLLLVCWVLPTKILSVNRRSIILGWLDTLGKWSLIEFYFLMFVLYGFKTDPIGSPEAGFLPKDDLFRIEFLIELRRGIYIFSAAVIISLFLANLALVYNSKAKRAAKNEKKFTDGHGFSVAFTPFRNECATGIDDKLIRTSPLGRVIFVLSILFCVGLTPFLFTIVFLKSTMIGLIGLVAELDGVTVETTYSIDAIASFLTTSEVQPEGYVALCVVLIMTILLIPVVQQIHLLYIFFRKQSIASAEKSIQTNELLSAWCCLEVFVLGVIVLTLEVKEVSKGFIEDECEPIEDPLVTLASLGIISDEDADAACFALKAELFTTTFVFLIVIFLSRVTTYLVLTLLEMASHQQRNKVDGEYHNQRKALGYRVLRLLRLVEVNAQTSRVAQEDSPSSPAERAASDNVVTLSTKNPMLTESI